MPIRFVLLSLSLCLGAACGGVVEPLAPGESPQAPAAVEQAVSTSVAGTALRYLTLNVGNASPQYGCWEYKMCRPEDAADLRAYIQAWQPDILLLTEVYRAAQLTGEVVWTVGSPLGFCEASFGVRFEPPSATAQGYLERMLALRTIPREVTLQFIRTS